LHQYSLSKRHIRTYDMSCSIDDSTSLPLSDFRKDGRPGVMATVAAGMTTLRYCVAILFH
jgi:hypothetical protein